MNFFLCLYTVVKIILNKMQRIFHPVGQGALFSERFFETETAPNPRYLNYERSFFPFKSIFHLAGCLYTGDADFNEPNLVSDLEKRLSDLTANIGTLVAPHHGAIVNFNEELLTIVPSLQSTIFPYGKENSYGHPSDSVVANIVGHNIFMSIIPDPWRTPRNMIIRVTEDVSSVAIFKFNIS